MLLSFQVPTKVFYSVYYTVERIYDFLPTNTTCWVSSFDFVQLEL